MLNQRKHSAACSSANISNQKRHENHLCTSTITKSLSEASYISEIEREDSPGPRRRSAASRNSAERFMLKTGKEGSGGAARQNLSNGSCATPSPMFSIPVSSLSSNLSSDSQAIVKDCPVQCIEGYPCRFIWQRQGKEGLHRHLRFFENLLVPMFLHPRF